MNNKNTRIFKHGFTVVISFVIAIIILTCTGCEIGGYKEGKNYKINSFNDVLKALKDRGQKPKEIIPKKDKAQNSYFSVNARNVGVNGEIISIYEFKDAETASSQAKTISKDGYTVANNKISWTDEPHFYLKGNIIVSYIGKDRTLLFDLYAILGNSIT